MKIYQKIGTFFAFKTSYKQKRNLTGKLYVIGIFSSSSRDFGIGEQ
ncbi:MAG: hypothetical protein HPY66_0358 [Firmicutes bacterium]|nr:hypothetical protein [Bacillota bacterium]